MKIGILQAGRSPDSLISAHGDYHEMFVQLLSGHGFEFVHYPVLDNQFPLIIDECDAWLITGSKFGAYEKHSWIPPLEALIREIYAAAIPLVGICFGHQIMAQALGGRVEKYNAGWGLGLQSYQRTGSDQKLNLLAWHQDQVVVKPADAEVVAYSDFCQFAVLRYKDHAFSVQAHPEFRQDFVRDLFEVRKNLLPENIIDETRKSLEKDLKIDDMTTEIVDFFRKSNKF